MSHREISPRNPGMLGICPVCRKRRYASKRAAKQAARRIGKGRTVYRAHHPTMHSTWHITSNTKGQHNERPDQADRENPAA